MSLLLSYLDPGAGSLMLQMILAGLLGLSYTLKTFGRRIVRFVRRDKKTEVTSEAPAPEQQP